MSRRLHAAGAARSAARLSLRRLFSTVLLVALLLPPAAPAVAAAPVSLADPGPAASVDADVSGVPQQEGEPAPTAVPAQELPAQDAPPADLPLFSFGEVSEEPVEQPISPLPLSAPAGPFVSLVPAPVLLEVLSRQAVVTAGELFTVTVRASPTRVDTPLPEGLALSVQLPAGVALLAESAGAPLTFSLPPLGRG